MATLSHDVLNKTLIKNRHVNFESTQQYDAQPKYAAQKMFKDFFKNNRDLTNKTAPNTHISPEKS